MGFLEDELGYMKDGFDRFTGDLIDVATGKVNMDNISRLLQLVPMTQNPYMKNIATKRVPLPTSPGPSMPNPSDSPLMNSVIGNVIPMVRRAQVPGQTISPTFVNTTGVTSMKQAILDKMGAIYKTAKNTDELNASLAPLREKLQNLISQEY